MAVLLAYILLRVFLLIKVFVQKNFRNNLTLPKMSHSAHSLSLYMTPYLNTLTRLKLELYPILIHYTRILPKAKKLSAANQNRLQKDLKFRQPIRIEFHSAEKYPRPLGYGWGPFSALGSSLLDIAYRNTSRDLNPSPDQLTLLLLKYFYLNNLSD